MDTTEVRTLILRKDKRLPNRYVCPSPTGRTSLVGTDPEGHEITKPIKYVFSKGVPTHVHIDDFAELKKIFKKDGDSIIPLFATSAEKAGTSASTSQRVADVNDDLKVIIEALANQGTELPESLLEKVGLAEIDEDEGGKACESCGNLHPGSYEGECLRCGAEV